MSLKWTTVWRLAALWILMGAAWAVLPAHAQTGPKIGVVVMHGKGGSPSKHVSELASALQSQGYLIANLEMPWSGRREFNTMVGGAESEVESALATLRSKGAQKVFVAGHSQGGLFALYFGSRHPVDGVIAIAPGGDPSSGTAQEKLAEYVDQARKLVADGKGDERTRFADYEGGKGVYAISTTPKIYLDWFDPEVAPGMGKAAKAMNPATPVLYIGPSNDYPGLIKAKGPTFGALPKNPLTKLYEPSSTHLGAPSASIPEILEWTAAVANQP